MLKMLLHLHINQNPDDDDDDDDDDDNILTIYPIITPFDTFEISYI